MVVELGRAHALVLGADPAIVPVGHDEIPVRIQVRDHDGDGVLQNFLHLIVGACGESVQHLRRRLAGRHLGRMEAVSLHEHHLAVGKRVVDLHLRAPAWVLEDRVSPLDLVEVRQVCRRGHENHQEGIPERAGPDVPHVDAIAQGAEGVVVGDEPIPPRQLSVGTHLVAEEVLRRGNGLRHSRGGEPQHSADNEGERRG